jgi:hypothetical protein
MRLAHFFDQDQQLILSPYGLVFFHYGIASWTGALEFGSVAWIGFPAMWENVAWRLAAIHAGDRLAKLLLMTLIPGLWRSVNA